ncbi:MAG: aldo/keto reductase [Anaerolineae bacterium]|nr:aldo/keto reductase [Anaerolineae bacterium]MDW8098471.1 aldo/keto reductase [Anaerolineae bacterium]
MEYRSLGRTGVMVSPLCLGAMNFGGPTPEDESIRIIHRALDAGINFIDTANVYNAGESERIIGKALKENGKRDQVVLATKVHGRMGEGPNDQGNSRYHIMKACEDSLRRLQTDHIDLYQLHRPSLTIPQDETLRALDDLVRQGKVRYIGCSTFPAWMVMEAIAISERMGLARFVSEQPPYNLLDRRIENELIPLAQRYGLAILPWSPLAGGILAGRYTQGQPFPEDSRAGRHGGTGFFVERITAKGLEVAGRLAERARERGMTASQLALLWCKDQPGVTSPIIGPRTMAHLEELLPVLEMSLSDEDRAFCDELVHPGNAVSDFHNSNPWMKARIF